MQKDNDWVKKCMEYEVKGSKARGRPKRTWIEVWKRTIKHVSLTRRMLSIIVDAGS